MKALRSFTVRPSLPAELTALETLAMNLRWAWDDQTRDLFRWVDPEQWDASIHDPVRLLGLVPRAPRDAGRRPRLHALPRRGAHRAVGLPVEAAVVPGARGHDGAAVGRLLLAGVRHRRSAPAVLRRPRRARRRPSEGVLRPRRAARRRRAVLPPRLLPPRAVGRRLAAGALPRPRPVRDGRHALRRREDRGRPRGHADRRAGVARTSGGCRCTCSTPTSTRTPTTCAR